MARKEWPFAGMAVGEALVLWDVDPVRAAVVAHNTRRAYGWRFKTAKVVEGDRVGLVVKRRKDNPLAAAALAGKAGSWGAGEPVRHRDGTIWYTPRKAYGFEHLQPGEEVKLGGQTNAWYAKTVAAVHGRNRAGFGISKYSISEERAPGGGEYLSLTVRRTK